MPTQNGDFATEGRDDLASVFDASLFDDVLDDVVAVLIADESFHVGVDLVQEGISLVWRAVLQSSLNHPASVRVSR